MTKTIEESISNMLTEKNMYLPSLEAVVSIFADMVGEYKRLENNHPEGVIMNDVKAVLKEDMVIYADYLNLNEEDINSIMAGK